MAIILFFPLEYFFHIIEKSALFLTGIFQGMGGVTFISPLKITIDPVAKGLQHLLSEIMGLPDIAVGIIMLVIAVALVVTCLIHLVKMMRSLMVNQTEKFVDRYLFRNTATAFLLGMLLTAAVQSSSVTTSIMVPMVAAGFLALNRAYPFTLGPI
jgi:sodium-dependent phosphate cotransporter